MKFCELKISIESSFQKKWNINELYFPNRMFKVVTPDWLAIHPEHFVNTKINWAIQTGLHGRNGRRSKKRKKGDSGRCWGGVVQ